MKKFSSQSGFTLFTALIGFILLVLSLLLVQSMISTERSTSDIISDISGQQEMQAIADLARADALQVFNFGIRYTIEDFSTHDNDPQDGVPDNEYVMYPSYSQNWGILKDKFVKDRFGVGVDATGNQFATLAAKHLISLLERTDDARGFDIELQHPNESKMQQILSETFNNQSENSSNEFFQVIGCEEEEGLDHYANCIGTFYVTMDLSRQSVTPIQYEQFPRVKVINQQTGRILLEPILPRGKFRIYVPVRLFKALGGARQVGFSANGIFNDQAFNDNIKTLNKIAAKEQVEAKVEQLVQDMKEEKDGFLLDRFEVIVTTQGAGTLDDPETVVSYRVRLYFKETNEKYMVSSQGLHIYAVMLVNDLR